jgi:hypothetical protein
MKEDDLGILYFALGRRIKLKYGLEYGNQELLQFCGYESGQQSIDPYGATVFIIQRLWAKVQNTRVLKGVK